MEVQLIYAQKFLGIYLFPHKKAQIKANWKKP